MDIGDLVPGKAARDSYGKLGIVARVPSGLGPRFEQRGIVHGPATIIVTAAENVRKNWHAVVHPDASIGGRKPGARGRRGIRTLAGARWLDDVKRGDVGRVQMRGSGPRGGRPR